MGNTQKDPMDMIYIIIGIVALFVLLNHYYESHRAFFNGLAFKLSYLHLYPVAWFNAWFNNHVNSEWLGVTDAYKLVHGIDWDAPGDYSKESALKVIDVVSRYWAPVYGVTIGLIAVLSLKSGINIETYRRKFGMMDLIRHNAEHFPCMAPIANRKKSIIDEPYDTGPWRTARTPLQFAIENQLLVNLENKPLSPDDVFDKFGLPSLISPVLLNNKKDYFVDFKKARDIFIQQLGPLYKGVEHLNSYEKGLFAAFLAFISGNKKDGQALLDAMSLSFVEAENGKPCRIAIPNANNIIQRDLNHPDVVFAMAYHASYKSTLFMSLLNHARKKGVLACSQFIWLRPTDRLLWYTLNQVGGVTSWSEALGPWGHYQIEEIMKTSLDEPEIDHAILGFEKEVVSTGFADFRQNIIKEAMRLAV